MRASLLGLLLWPAVSLAADSNSSFVPLDRTSDHFNVSEAIERVKADASVEANFRLNSAFSILGVDASAELLELPVGTCNAQTPCVNGACCSGVCLVPYTDLSAAIFSKLSTNALKITGLCGYSPSECGAGNCTSNCDAKAECGQYGFPGKRQCPLGVCCSKFG
jgi:hypothetical protein